MKHQLLKLKTVYHDNRTPKGVLNRAGKRKANEDKRFDETYTFMKAVLEQSTKRDEYRVFDEHVANKLRNCGRCRYDTAIAQHEIGRILFNLEMGA